MKRLIVLGAVSLSGCSGALLGGGDRIDLTPLRTAEVVPFAEIVQNIRCDVQSFLTNNPHVTSFSIGGLITAKTLDDTTSGASVGGTIPVATSISAALGAEKSSTRSLGIENKQAIIVYREDPIAGKPAVPPIDCSPAGFLAAIGQAPRLSGPLLNLTGMRSQMERFQTGNPRLRLPGFRIDGSIYLVKNQKTNGKIQVFFVSGGVDRSKSSSFRIDFDIATNWKPIVKDYEVEAPKEAPAPSPTVVYVVQSAPPTSVRKPEKPGKPGAALKPGEPPITVIEPWMVIPKLGIPGLMQQPASQRDPVKEAAEKVARETEEASRPKTDVPK